MNSKNEYYWLLEAPVSKAIWHMAIPMILDGLLIISSLMFNYYAMKYGDYVLASLVLIPAIVIGNQLFQLNGVIFSLLVSEAISCMTGCVMYYLIRSK